MVRETNRDCGLCRVMRSMAFSGLGAGIGAVSALLFGASKQNVMMSALIVAAVFVFALANRKK